MPLEILYMQQMYEFSYKEIFSVITMIFYKIPRTNPKTLKKPCQQLAKNNFVPIENQTFLLIMKLSNQKMEIQQKLSFNQSFQF
jgi:hypothetical protein